MALSLVIRHSVISQQPSVVRCTCIGVWRLHAAEEDKTWGTWIGKCTLDFILIVGEVRFAAVVPSCRRRRVRHVRTARISSAVVVQHRHVHATLLSALVLRVLVDLGLGRVDLQVGLIRAVTAV